MGHCLHAFIGQQDILTRIVNTFEQAHMISLPQGFGLIPLLNEFADDVHLHSQTTERHHFHEFDYLSDALATMVAHYSCFGHIAYIETDYFGGEGGQAAVVWHNKVVVWGPFTEETSHTSKSPISQALHVLGVQQGTAYDEFDALGLGRFRHTEQCFEQR